MKIKSEVINYMRMKVDMEYWTNWKQIYVAISGYHGRPITTSFNDIEILKLVNYLSINLELK